MFEAQTKYDLLSSPQYKSYVDVLSAHPGNELVVKNNEFISN